MKRLFLLAFIAIVTHQVARSQTQLVKDINTNLDADLTGGKDFFTKSGDLAYFMRIDEKGNELWRTDGTKEGTFRISDVVKGYAAATNLNTNFTDLDGELYFTNSSELWKTDGSIQGTQRLTSLVFQGLEINIQRVFKVGNKIGLMTGIADGNNRAYHLFSYSDSDQTINHIKSLGTTTSTNPVFAVGEQRVYITLPAVTPGNSTTWISDGTTDGTHELASLANKGSFFQMAEVGDLVVARTAQKLVMVNVITDNEEDNIMLPPGEFIQGLYPTGTSVLVATDKNILVAGSQGGLTTAISNVRLIDMGFGDNRLHILGVDRNNNESNIYYTDSDGVWEGYFSPLGISPGALSEKRQVLVVDDNAFTISWVDGLGAEPTFIDGITADILTIKDIRPGVDGSNPQSFIELNGKILFVAGETASTLELWTTDGTEDGTHRVLDPATRTRNGVDNRDFFVFNDQVWFMGYDATNGVDLWHSNTDGTNALKDQTLSGGFPIGGMNNEFYAWSNNVGFTRTDGNGNVTVYFTPDGGMSSSVAASEVIQIGNKLIAPMVLGKGGSTTTGYEMWVTDGTEAGTHILKDIYPGIGAGIQMTTGKGRAVKINDNTAVFIAGDPDNGFEMWKTDGTTDGTVLIKDITPGIESTNTSNLTLFKNKAYFVASNSTMTAKVWVTDGTAEGTFMLEGQDPNSKVNGNLRATDNYLLFTTDNNGWAIYRTDGSSSVQKVKQLDTNSNAKLYPANSMALGNKMYFNYDDGNKGRELWVTDGTEAGTRMIDMNPDGDSRPTPLAVADGQMYINLNSQLYRIGGPKPEIEKISDMDPIIVAKAGNNVYFKAFSNEYGVELFKVPVSKFGQTIEFNVADRKLSDGDFTLDAIASSGLNVAYTSTSSTVAITGANVDVKSAGKATIQATQAGDGVFNAAESVTATFCINPEKPEYAVLTDFNHALTSMAPAGNQWFLNGEAIPGATSQSYMPQESGIYSVQVTIDGCKSEMGDPIPYDINGLGDEVIDSSIYPNPVEHTLFVTAPAQLRIIDSSGREAFNQQVVNSVDVSSLTAGMYIAILNNRCIKFIKR